MRRRAVLALAGAGFASPRLTRGQQRSYSLAIVTHTEPVDRATGRRERYWAAFLDELARLGYEDGRNLAIAWHSSQVDAERAAELARAVAARRPDAIFTPDARMGIVLKQSAAPIPVVAITIDPVGSGIAASLARPGGNVTGFSVDAGLELIGKRLEFFRQAVPAASRVAWLTPRRTMGLPLNRVTRETMRQAGITLIDTVMEAPVDADSFRRAFDAMARDRVDSVWAATTGEVLQHRQLIAGLATAARLPTIFGWRENVEAGGLLSYGNDVADTFRQSAGYIDRILKGASPAEMPFQQPARFELVVNARTARMLGLTLPPSLLLRADEVIE
jgi:putative ABC transport system substrate-binding protein